MDAETERQIRDFIAPFEADLRRRDAEVRAHEHRITREWDAITRGWEQLEYESQALSREQAHVQSFATTNWLLGVGVGVGLGLGLAVLLSPRD